jgi:hypothetical protein
MGTYGCCLLQKDIFTRGSHNGITRISWVRYIPKEVRIGNGAGDTSMLYKTAYRPGQARRCCKKETVTHHDGLLATGRGRALS